MSVLEIEAPTQPTQQTLVPREIAISVTQAMLGLASRPGFLPSAMPAMIGPDRSLWDTLCISWTEPQTKRDLLGG